MVNEIVTIQVGQCGNQIGNAWWTAIGKEHKVARNGLRKGRTKQNATDQLRLDKIDVYYQEHDTKRFSPRCCLIDLEPSTMDVIMASPMSKLFKPDNMCFGAGGVNSSFPKGHYTEGAELVDEAVDIIRKETEACECPQGFQLLHSIGGGTGSGMGTLLLLKLRDDYPDRITMTHTVFPSPKVSQNVHEPYNAVLASHQLLENADVTFVYDNEALYNICCNNLKQKEPKYADLNFIIANVISDVTATFRLPSNNGLNDNFRKFGVNLVPFPRLHFFLISHAPLFVAGKGHDIEIDVDGLNDQIHSRRNFMANVAPDDGKYMCRSTVYRGIEADSVEPKHGCSKDHPDEYLEWNPHHINVLGTQTITNGYINSRINIQDKIIPIDIMRLCRMFYHGQRFKYNPVGFMTSTCVVSVPPLETPQSGTMISNTTAIKGVFQVMSAKFHKMFKRKAFVRWPSTWADCGGLMDEMEMGEAAKNVRDVIWEYQDKQDAIVKVDEIMSDKHHGYFDYDSEETESTEDSEEYGED